MSTTTSARHWWRNDSSLKEAIVKEALQLPREPMARLRAEGGVPALPGVYVVFFASVPLVELFGDLVGAGRVPAYVGVAKRSLRERTGRYAQTLRGTGVSPENLHFALLPCSSEAGALFAESALIEAFDPVCNGMGWGSKVPGRRRTTQRCSAMDAILGRNWTTPPSPIEAARARVQVLSYLAKLEPTGHRWPALLATQAQLRPGTTRRRRTMPVRSGPRAARSHS